MWSYSKKLQYPVNIKTPNAAAAKVIISQLGGPDGELGAATRYLSQRYTAPWGQVRAGLTDVGTEELAHIELVSTILYQLTRNLKAEEIEGTPQKARVTYDNILRLVDDPDILDPIRFLREREIVHFQRFGEMLRIAQEQLDSKNFYAFNPSFDGVPAKPQTKK